MNVSPQNVYLLMDLFDHVEAVGVDVILRNVDDLDGVRLAGFFANTSGEDSLKNLFQQSILMN